MSREETLYLDRKDFWYLDIDVVETGMRLKAVREAHNFKVPVLQRILFLDSKQAISNWERGKCLPKVANLYALSCLYGCSINSLLVTHEYRSNGVCVEKIGGTAEKTRVVRMMLFPV